MIKRLLTSILILASFLPIGMAASGKEDASGKPAQAQATETTYIVEWDIQAYGYEDYQVSNSRFINQQEITITGKAVVHKPAGGDNTTIPMRLMITDNSYRHTITDCPPDQDVAQSETHDRKSITDPGRYNGGPDPIWNGWMLDFMTPAMRPDGSWYMPNPFFAGMFVRGSSDAGIINRDFNYHSNEKSIGCLGDTYVYSSDEDLSYYEAILETLSNTDLEGDPTGTVFTLDTEYIVSGVPDLTVNFHATVRVAGACEVLPAPIDISNPAITNRELSLQAENTTPDGTADLQALVTCEGIPVVDAPVVVTMEAKPGSGGHSHDDGKRPRGYIDGVEITEGTKYIGITGSDGSVSFTIEAGRDLTNKSRGIAGVYLIDAWIERDGFELDPKHAYVKAGLNLVPLPENPNLYLFNPSPAVHSQVHYGTPGTVFGIQELVQDWIADQTLHNWSLTSQGKEPWPVLDVLVSGVSLPKGGLFDVNAAGSGMWRPPFNRHRAGEEALIQPFYFSEPSITTEQRLWYDRAFRELGNEYGTWFSDGGVPYNLKIAQAGANLKESSILVLGKTDALDPDAAVSAALINPAGRFVAGTGQTVIYSVGVENLAADTVASEVELRAELPTGLNFISANPIPSRMEDPRTPVWDIGSLPDEAAPRAFDITAQVDPSTAIGSLLNITATATSTLDANPANNQFTDWGLTVQPPGPDLVVASDLSGIALTASDVVTFNVHLNNEGNAPATAGWLELMVPAGINILNTEPTSSVIPDGMRWEAGDLLPGEQQTFTIALQPDPSLLDLPALDPDLEPEYPLAFTLEAGSGGTDIDPVSNLLQVDKRVEIPGPDLFVASQTQGTPGPGVIEVGQEVTYTLNYGNFGNWEAGEASMSLSLWPGLALLESQPAPTTNQLDPVSGVRTLTWNLGELPIGEEGTITMRLRVDDVPDVGSLIKADISSNSIDLNPADNLVMEIRFEASASPPGGYQNFLPVITR